jgi:hypothetical protein
MRRGVLLALLGAALLGGLNTLGDFLWARFVRSHRMLFGIAHGALLFLVLGIFLGYVRGRVLRGGLGGAGAGLAAALLFYVLAPLLGYAAMFPAWMALWIGLAWLDARLLRSAPTGPALVRGLVAAVGSGLAFYAISGIWTRPSPGRPDYAYHFACWTFAFLPGFLALLVERGRPD